MGTKPQKVKLNPQINAPPPEPKKPKFTFDAVGVGKYITDKAVRNWFWTQVEEAQVPFGWQAKLAALLANEAVEGNNGVLSLPFAKRYEEFIRLWVEYPDTDIDQGTMDQILVELNEEKLKRLAEDLKKRLYALARAANELTDFAEKVQSKNPQLLSRIFDRDFRRFGLGWLRRSVDKLTEKFPPD